MNDTEILQLITFGSKLWQNWNTPKVDADLALTMRAWRATVGNLDRDLVEAVMVSLSTTREFPPTPGQLYAECVKFEHHRAGAMPDVDEALAEVLEAVRRIGHTGTPKWSNPAISQAVEAVGGWVEGVCKSENLPALRAHFAQAYATALARLEQSGSQLPIIERFLSEGRKALPSHTPYVSVNESLKELANGDQRP